MTVNEMTHIIQASRQTLGLDQFGHKRPDHYANRKYLYAFKSAHGSYYVVNYKADGNSINSFLTLFDVHNCNGHFKLCEDNNNLQEVWFEVTSEFVEMLKTNTEIRKAIAKFDVEIVFEHPFKEDYHQEVIAGMEV